ncbi:MAG: ATP-dependent RNA helicase HrpA [Lysobacteraceae bacterium]
MKPHANPLPQVDKVLTRDRGRLLGLRAKAASTADDDKARATFLSALEKSQAAFALRAQTAPVPTFDDTLPVAREGERIIELLRAHQVIVIAGETGSGKTTQLPKLCLAAGRGVAGMIGCTQPRRIAARAVARRVAEELQTPMGAAVGYQVRFTEQVGSETRIKFMTDGILLAEIQSDRWLSAYDTLIIDEAHERSLNIDFLLGYLKTLLRRRRDLKVIVTSATIDTARFAAHFDEAPVFSVEGRSYPVEVRYRSPDDAVRAGEEDGERGVSERGMAEAIVAAADEITREDPLGDILIFLPGEREIRDAHLALERRKYRHTEVLALYARLSTREQDRVFQPGPQRRIVLATNVAETSLTVPRIRYVIDPGVARIKRYSPRGKLDRLHLEAISQASADQRKGRCGRVAAGVCYRLYSEADFQSRPRYTDPEILRASLAGVILRMLGLGLGRLDDFPFVEAPDARAVADGWQQLTELGAVDAERKLTLIGRQMARLPVDVKLARMLIAANQHGCLREMTAIAAFLGISDPRERPADARGAADTAHAKFADPKSEFIGVLKLWDAYQIAHAELTQSKLRGWCEQHFLGFLRMREWRELHRQLLLLCDELGWSSHRSGGPEIDSSLRRQPAKPDRRTASPTAKRNANAREVAIADNTVDYRSLHRALIAGLTSQIGHRGEKGQYDAPRQRKFTLFPGSTLAAKPPPWVLSALLLDTQRVWALTNAVIEPDWVIAELPHLLARRHFDAHWSRAQGNVLASEQISLFGLVLAPKRPVHFGRINPSEAHMIFVQQALVTGEINTRAAFVARNLDTLEKAREEEAKLRRAGIVSNEDWQARWYLDRLPPELCSAAGLDAWYAKLPADNKHALEWSLTDLLPGEGSEHDRFPAQLALGDARLALHYRFEPGCDDDGVTLDVPLHLLQALDPVRLGWLVPGLVADKATALIRGLPKTLRRNYVPAPDFARAFAEAWLQPSADAFTGELARFLGSLTGAAIHALEFDADALEPHLRMNFRLAETDARGQPTNVLAQSRDLAALRERFGERAAKAFAARAGRELQSGVLNEFPPQPIPESILGEAGVPAFPALQLVGEDVTLQVFADRTSALEAHPAGVRRLLRIALIDAARQAQKQLPIAPKSGLLYAAIEGFGSKGHGVAAKQQLQSDLVDGALSSLLADDLQSIRDRAQFSQRLEAIRRGLFGEAMQRLQLAERIFSAHAVLRPWLDQPLLGFAAASYDDLRMQLQALMQPGFLREWPQDILASFPRYLAGMQRRAEKLRDDPQRDQVRLLELQPFLDALEKAAARDLLRTPDWQQLRWDVEELRLSLFAQELGSAKAVSIKRLARNLQSLRAQR